MVKNIGTNDDQAFLQSWSEVDYSRVELVVITDDQGHKLVEHRTPFLYYSNQIDLKYFEEISKLIGEKV